MRDLFTTGPGPDKGGSKPGQKGWVHMPEKSGVGAAPTAGANVCPQARVAVAMANVTDRTNSRRCILVHLHRDTRLYPKRRDGARPSHGQAGFRCKSLLNLGYQPRIVRVAFHSAIANEGCHDSHALSSFRHSARDAPPSSYGCERAQRGVGASSDASR